MSAEPSEYVLSIQQLIEDGELPPDSLSVLAKLDVTKYKLSADSRGIVHKVIDEANSHTYELSCSKIEFPSPALFEPAVGELKFMPVEKLHELYDGKMAYYGDKQNVDIYADDFDGWVFPNGVTFTCEEEDFEKAKAVFGRSSKSFTVPCLDTFINAVTDKNDDTVPLSRLLQQVKTGPHAHALKVDNIHGSLDLTEPEVMKLKLTTSTPPGASSGSHEIPSDKSKHAVAYFGGSPSIVQKSTGWKSSNVDVDLASQLNLDMQTAPNDPDGSVF